MANTERSDIGLLNAAATIGAVGFMGYHGYNAYNRIKATQKPFVKVVNEVREDLLKDIPQYTPEDAKLAGLNTFKTLPNKQTLAINEIENFFKQNNYMDEHQTAFKSLFDWMEELRGRGNDNIALNVRNVMSDAHTLQLSYTRGGKNYMIPLGQLTKGGLYPRANVGRTFGVAPFIALPGFVDSVKAGSSYSEVGKKIVPFNTGVIEIMRAKSQTLTNSELRQQFQLLQQLVETVSTTDPRSTKTFVAKHKVIALADDDKFVRKFTPFDEGTADVLRQYMSIVEKEGIAPTKLISLMNEENIGSLTFMHPEAKHPFKWMDFSFGKAARQTFTKESLIDDPRVQGKTLGDFQFSIGGKQGSNIVSFQEAQDMIIGDQKISLLDELLSAGIGNKGKPVTPIGGTEGVYISKELAKIKRYDAQILRASLDPKNVHSVAGLESTIDDVIIAYLKHHQDLGHSFTDANKWGQWRYQLGMGLGAETEAKQWFDFDNFRNLKKGREEDVAYVRREILNNVSNIEEINRFLHDNPMQVKGRLLYDNTGKSLKAGKYGNQYVFNISGGGTKEGLALNTFIESELGEFWKVWGTGKNIALGELAEATELNKWLYGLTTAINEKPDDTQKIINYLTEMKKGDATARAALEAIVSEHIKNAPENIINNPMTVFTSTGIRHDEPTLRAMSISETLAELVEQKQIPAQYIDDFIANAPAQTPDDFIQSTRVLREQLKTDKILTESQLNVLLDPALSDAGGFRKGIHAIASTGTLRGLGMKTPVDFNAYMVKRFQDLGMPKIAENVKSMMNLEPLTEMIDLYMGGITGKLPKDSAIIDAGKILAKERRDILFGGDLNEAREVAKQLALETNPKQLVSNNTKFYIQLAEEAAVTNSIKTRYVPVPLIDHPSYVGEFGFGEESLKKVLSREAESAAIGLRPNSVRNMYDTASKIILDKKWYTVEMPGSRMLELGGEALSSRTFMESVAAMDKSVDVPYYYKKYGLDPDNLDNMLIGGVSSEDFWHLASQTDDYKRLMRTVDKNLPLAQRRAMISSRLHKRGVYTYGGRHPEGYFGVQIYDAESLARDLNLDPKSLNLKQGTIHYSRIAKSIVGSDLDSDPMALAVAKTLGQKREVKSLLANNSDIIRALKEKEKGFIAKGAKKQAASLAQRAATAVNTAETFSSGVGRISNIIENFTNAAQRSFDDVEKRLGVLFLGSHLREQTITSTGMSANKEAFNEFINIFTMAQQDKNSIAEGAKKLQEQAIALNIKYGESGNYYRDRFTLKDFEKTLQTYRDSAISTDQLVHANIKKQNTAVTTSDLLETMGQLSGTNSTGAGSVESEMLITAANRNRSKVKTGISIIQDVSEEIVNAAKNNRKLFGTIGAVAAGAYFLIPRSEPIANQEIREESRPKITSSPTAAQAIDPQVGRVYKPAPQGYKLSVRGNLPPSVNSQRLVVDMSKLGYTTSGSVINRNPVIDADYVNKLQQEDRLNKWNG